MTEYIPQISASERVDMARKALRYYDRADLFAADPKGHPIRSATRLADTMRALIEPPMSLLESEQEVIEHVAHEVGGKPQMDAYREMFLAGVQWAHERWEPSDIPSQEQMLRWLGIEYRASEHVEDALYIRDQYIQREEI